MAAPSTRLGLRVYPSLGRAGRSLTLVLRRARPEMIPMPDGIDAADAERRPAEAGNKP